MNITSKPAMKYFGRFSDRRNVAAEFYNGMYSQNFAPPEGFPSDDEILFASYGGGSYDGDAVVIYERDGTLYEVHGSHCSCYGLEGQWEPEATTWAALAMRQRPEEGEYYYYMHDQESEAITAYWALVEAHKPDAVVS